jgi:ribonuclease P/MRP protein subunit RPP40
VGENIMVDILWSFIKNKIDKNQFGVIKGGSTVTAMVKLVDDLLKAADNGLCSRILMLDFSKAFERIDHSILIRKLLAMEVPIWLCKWISGFLSERHQRVKYKGVCSSWKQIGTGVPQGTKFGPVGFIVLINDMVADLKFVDDSSLIEILRDPGQCTLVERVDALMTWASIHKMKLNPKKTTKIRICFKKLNHHGMQLS